MKQAHVKNIDKFDVQTQISRFGKEAYLSGEYLEVSDGYHTFDELYEHRFALFLALCASLVRAANNGLTSRGWYTEVWRSYTHSDGSKMEGWFVLGIGKEEGKQITYHLPNHKWEETEFAETLDQAPEFDGHTSADVLKRLLELN